MEGRVHRLLFLYFAAFAGVCVEGTTMLRRDEAALLAFRLAVDPDASPHPWNPLSDGGVCRWPGIACNRNGKRVTEVRLDDAGLSGNIPFATLGNLTALQALSLRSNALAGALPSDLANLPSLRALYLDNNGLHSQLPDGMLLGWPKLEYLDISFNRFHGPMPHSLNSLTRLALLNLRNNSFEGPLPTLDLPSLKQFSVAYNRLNGTIPSKSSYQNFQEDSFTGNDLCGYPLHNCNTIQLSPVPSPSATPAKTTPPPLPPVPIPVPVPVPAPVLDQEEPVENPTWTRDIKITTAVVGSVVGLAVLVCISILLCSNARKRKLEWRSRPPSMMWRHRAVHLAPDAMTPPDGGHSHYTQAAYSVRTANSVAVCSDLNAWKVGAGISEEPPSPVGLVFINGPASGNFTLQELLTAPAVELGHGVAGAVYKASLGADVVVVKRLHGLCVGYPEFKWCVERMGGLKHKNVLRLRAYYYSGKEKLLVYDYMPLGSLSSLLLLHGCDDEAKKKPLDWEMRKWLAMGAASGIAYIHERGLVHGNIKSNNILISKDYRSCIADFGIIQMKGGMPRSTSRSQKADVYNFGVVLLELLTGKLLRSFTDSARMSAWVEKSRFDPHLLHENNNDDNNTIKIEFMQMLHISVWCLASSPIQRPTMRDVVNLINNLCLH